jgi:hypothetical protein
MRNRNLIFPLLLIVLLQLTGATVMAETDSVQPEESYRFIVAGHAYGSHGGTNPGLYPLFYQYLLTHQNELAPSFLILNGDIVRTPDEASWQALEQELAALSYPAYYVLGNHDDYLAGRAEFQKKFGETYYVFRRGNDLFIILDAMKDRGRIPPEQLEFLRTQLSLDGIQNAFVFFHELIWTAHRSQYNSVRHNFGSYNRFFHSNFWQDVIPLLNEFRDRNIFVIAGDVAGNTGTVPAFYEELQHIHLVATGMGEIAEGNFLLVEVSRGEVELKLVPLNPDSQLQPLEFYTLDNLQPKRLPNLRSGTSSPRVPSR